MAGTPADIAAKWARNLGSATQSITAGVNAVSVAPGTQAVAQKALWLQRVTAAADKWARRTGSVSLEAWKAATIAGIPRIATGATQKVHKMESFYNEFLPVVMANAQKVHAMPKGDINASIARAAMMIQLNSQFRRSGH